MRGVILDTLVVIAVFCTITSMVVAIARQRAADRATRLTIERRKPVPVSHADQYASSGHLIGPRTAKLVIVEFTDFECPFCREFAISQLHGILRRHPDIAFMVRQRPMPYHRFAIPAAHAADCAAVQGKYAAFHDAIFAEQDSLGLKPFADYARLATVPDIDAFSRCVTTRGVDDGIGTDTMAANQVGVTATPSFILDGVLLTGVPDSAQFEQRIVHALLGQSR